MEMNVFVVIYLVLKSNSFLSGALFHYNRKVKKAFYVERIGYEMHLKLEMNLVDMLFN